MQIRRYYHTLRHLRPVQIYGRPWFHCYKPRPDLSSPPGIRRHSNNFQAPAQRLPSLLSRRCFSFLNQAHDVIHAADWNHPAWDKLWLYNLHYFDDLNARQADQRTDWHRGLIQRWIAENPPAGGNGWEPYPLSLRIVNWIKWALNGNELEKAWNHSLAIQIRYLRRRLEYHLLGNHLFANAKALVLAGLYFSGNEAEQWLQKGLDLIQRQLTEQILTDGGHFERSPMYHSLILEDLLDLINLAQTCPDAIAVHRQQQWREAAIKMLAWLRALCHPDGQIALFNDAAFAVAPEPAELFSYAGRLGLPTTHFSTNGLTELPASGYLRWQQEKSVVFLDVAPVGPDYLPAHAHADTLSFEWSLGTQRILVNSGTGCYGSSAERLRQRGTAAHNTVSINCQNSSAVWGGFRVAERAYPKDLQIRTSSIDTELHVSCAHDGYVRLPGHPVPHRSWLINRQMLEISDKISGWFDHACARFHFHPDIELRCGEDARDGELILSDDQKVRWHVDRGYATIIKTIYHEQFNQNKNNYCLNIKLMDAESRVRFTWD